MGRHTLKAHDGVGFLRAYTDEMLDAELVYSGYITVQLKHTVQRGVLEVEHAFVKASTPDTTRWTVRYVTMWPNSQDTTFEAFMYQCLVKLRRMLDDKYLYPGGKA